MPDGLHFLGRPLRAAILLKDSCGNCRERKFVSTDWCGYGMVAAEAKLRQVN